MPLNMNGLKGRMMYIPAPKGKRRELMFVYGHHSSLERWWGVMQDLNQYGAVTMPDLPGFGGMHSFYRIGKKPTIDNLADYLASFIKLRFKRKKVTVVGLSFGFVVVTRMLQKYPELTNRVELLVSVVGFARHDDFKFSKSRHQVYVSASRLFARRVPAILFKNLGLNPAIIKTLYHRTKNAKHKFKGLSKKEMKAMLDFEVHLWHTNDVRTHMHTSAEFLKLDNCTVQVNVPVWHVAVEGDNYFDNHRVEQHLRVIFPEVHVVTAKLDSHSPSLIASREQAAPMIPARLRKLLSS
jgi:pimeloyl-ACP methyl ester carboxylesterase